MVDLHAQYSDFQGAATEATSLKCSGQKIVHNSAVILSKIPTVRECAQGIIVARALFSGILVEKRFKNLRDIFKRKQQEVRDKQRSGAGAADIPTIKWPHFEAMLELTEVESEPVV